MTSQALRAYTLAERRAAQRRDVSLAAEISVAPDSKIPCHVMNVSAGGALLEFNAVIGLPPSFKIVIPDALFEAECRIAHQTGRHVGVQFTSNLREALARFS